MRTPTITAAACALLIVALGLPFTGDRTPSGIDEAAEITGWPPGLLHVLVLPTEPYVLVPVIALVAAWCLRAKRPRDALFAALAPTIAVAVNTWVLKPLFDRWKNDTLVYPSGH